VHKFPRESKDCVVVRSQHNEDDGSWSDRHGLKVAALLFSILMAWKVAWLLVAMVVINQWLVCLALAGVVGVFYLPFYWLVGWLAGVSLKEAQKENSLHKQLVTHWVITERSIKHCYANYFRCSSMNSVKACEVKDQHLQVTYQNNYVEQLPLDGGSSETQIRAAKVMLSNGLSSKPDTLEPLENSIEVESSYSKEALKAFKAHCPTHRYTRRLFYRRSIGIAVAYLFFMVFYAIVNGEPLFSWELLLTTLLLGLPEALSWWATDGRVPVRFLGW